jgi:hypothetical protein
MELQRANTHLETGTIGYHLRNCAGNRLTLRAGCRYRQLQQRTVIFSDRIDLRYMQ